VLHTPQLLSRIVAAMILGGCGGARISNAVAAPIQPAETTPDAAQLEERLVVEGEIAIAVDEVPRAVDAIRKRVHEAGGRIVREGMRGGTRAWSAAMKVRLPPQQVTAFVDWLDQTGEIERKEIRADDVSRTLFDQAIALENLELTLARLRKLLERDGLVTADILEIEKEMTRVRGEIERIKGERRWLEDRVAYATLEIEVDRRQGAVLRPEAKFYPGVRGSSLILLDPDGRKRVRFGAGGVVQFSRELRSSLEIDVFPETGDESSALIATLGAAAYSDFLGGGRRCFLNPFLGLRAGYGYLGESAFVAAADIGVELYKHQYVMVDTSLRITALVDGDGAEAGLVAGAGLVVAF